MKIKLGSWKAFVSIGTDAHPIGISWYKGDLQDNVKRIEVLVIPLKELKEKLNRLKCHEDNGEEGVSEFCLKCADCDYFQDGKCVCPCHWTSTVTSTNGPECQHANGWYVFPSFWIFTRKYFSCRDCWSLIPKGGWRIL